MRLLYAGMVFCLMSCLLGGVVYAQSCDNGLVTDFLPTKAGQALDRVLRDNARALEIGNQGKIEISLNMHCETGEVLGDIVITAHHVWGELWNPLTQKNVEIGAKMTIGGHFSYNLQTRELDGQLTFNFGTLDSILGVLQVGTLSIDLGVIRDLIEDTLDLNELLALIPNPAPHVLRRERRNQYAAVKQSYETRFGPANRVYHD